MRALPVPKDTIDLLITAGFAHWRGDASRAALEVADRTGQHLWDENYASVSFTVGRVVAAPRFEWQPVGELLSTRVQTEQILQIERSRLYLVETSCHHQAWDQSVANRFLTGLGRVVEAFLAGHPIVPSPDHAGVLEYDGLSRAVDEWDRTIGFRTVLTATDAHRIGEGRL